MLTVGPYRFTETDARRTLSNLTDWWAQLTDQRDATSVSHLWPEAERLEALSEADDLQAPLHEAWALLAETSKLLRGAGQLPATAVGSVAALHRSDGGVPKLPVDQVVVDHGGVVGDRQATRVHHGRPWQALCLWSGEVIDALATEAHPIRPGAAGENITIRGLAWSDVRAGVRLRIGTVLCECSMFTLPCKKNAQWFIGGDFDRMHHRHGPWSRVYATVLEPGSISTDDVVTLEG